MSIQFHPKTFSIAVAELVRACHKMAYDCVNLHYEYPQECHPDDVSDLEENVLGRVITLQVAIIAAAELLGLHRVAELAGDLPKKTDGKPCVVKEISQATVGYSPSASYLQHVANGLLLAIGETVSESSIDMLGRILRATATIIQAEKIKPDREADVQSAIYKHLRFIYPDARREVRVPKKFKSYRPDIGVPTLQTAIEYKFCKTKEDVSAAVEGIYADMRGYAGTKEWQHFFAVIYQSDAFFTQEELVSEFKLSESDKNWTPILVHGTGPKRRANTGRIKRRK